MSQIRRSRMKPGLSIDQTSKMRHDTSPGPGISSLYISCLIFCLCSVFYIVSWTMPGQSSITWLLVVVYASRLGHFWTRGSALTSERAVLFRIRAELFRIRAVRFGVDLISEFLVCLICQSNVDYSGCWKGSRVRSVFTLTVPISSSVLELAIRRLAFCGSSIRDLQKFWTCILSNKGFVSGESHTLFMFSSLTSLVRLLTLEFLTLIFVFMLSFVLSLGISSSQT